MLGVSDLADRCARARRAFALLPWLCHRHAHSLRTAWRAWLRAIRTTHRTTHAGTLARPPGKPQAAQAKSIPRATTSKTPTTTAATHQRELAQAFRHWQREWLLAPPFEHLILRDARAALLLLLPATKEVTFETTGGAPLSPPNGATLVL